MDSHEAETWLRAHPGVVLVTTYLNCIAPIWKWHPSTGFIFRDSDTAWHRVEHLPPFIFDGPDEEPWMAGSESQRECEGDEDMEP